MKVITENTSCALKLIFMFYSKLLFSNVNYKNVHFILQKSAQIFIIMGVIVSWKSVYLASKSETTVQNIKQKWSLMSIISNITNT